VLQSVAARAEAVASVRIVVRVMSSSSLLMSMRGVRVIHAVGAIATYGIYNYRL
jgi:hypothetical protein